MVQSHPSQKTASVQPSRPAGAGDSRGPKILRIGIFQGGKPIEERLVRKRESVTIGQ